MSRPFNQILPRFFFKSSPHRFYDLDKWTWTGLLAANDVAYADSQVISKYVAMEAKTREESSLR